MSKVEVIQINSKGNRYGAFMNVKEDYGFIEVSGTVYEKETYLLTNGIHFCLVQFDKDSMQKTIKNYFAGLGEWKVIKIEKDSFIMESK